MREVETIVCTYPLHIALHNPECTLDALKLLLVENKAHVNIKSLDRSTPLHVAARRHVHNSPIIRELLKHGASVHLTDTLWETALHVAVKNCDDNLDAVRELLSYGSSVNVINCEGDTPLHIAVKRNFMKVAIELIRSSGAINISDINGDTALQLAIRNSNIKIVKELLKKGAEINRCNHQWNSPLHTAVECRDLCVVKELLRHPMCDVNFTNRKRNTPLHVAAEEKEIHFDILKELLKHGASIHFSNLALTTPLSYTLGEPGDRTCTKLMIQYALFKEPTWKHEELKNSSFKNYRCGLDCFWIINFINQCLAEIARMKNTRLGNSSLYEFTLQENTIGYLNACGEYQECISNQMLSLLLTTPFPIYYERVAECIKKSCLHDKLMELRIYASPELSRDKVMLDCYSSETLITFLSNIDMINLIIAYSPIEERDFVKRLLSLGRVSILNRTGPPRKRARF